MVVFEAFILVSLITVIAAVLMFLLKDVLHIVLSLSMIFLLNSLIFLFMGQTLLAAIQIFVMIGGVSTFLFVGAASMQYSKFSYSRVAILSAMSILLFAVIAYPLTTMNFTGMAQSQFNSASIAQQFEGSTPIFYIMALTMFGVCFGAVLILRRIGAAK